MTVPSNSGTKKSLSLAIERIENIAAATKSSALNIRDASALGPIVARRPLQFMEELTEFSAQVDALKAVVGLNDYAKQQYSDPALNLTAELTAMQTAMAAYVTWVTANIPTDTVSGRWILVEEIVNGQRVDRTFSVAVTAPMRTTLNALLATID